MEFLWLLMPIGCIVMMLVGRSGKESSWGCFQHHQPRKDPEETGNGAGRFDRALQRRASAAGLSPDDTERLRRILNATTDQGTDGHGALVAPQDQGTYR